MNKLAFIPLSLLVTLLATMMSSSALASECFENDSNRVGNKTDTNVDSDLDLAQMIKCLTEELASFEKTNQELRVKVSELEKTVFEGFEGFESNLSEKNVPEKDKSVVTYLKTNLSDEKVTSKISVDAVEKNRVSENNHQ